MILDTSSSREQEWSGATAKEVCFDVMALIEARYLETKKTMKDAKYWQAYQLRVQQLEAEGLTTSDAQSVIDAEERS